MPKRVEHKPALAVIRETAGFSPVQAAEKIAIRLNKSIAFSALIAWERRGTRNIDYIEAMSDLYRLPANVISEAARPS